MILNIDDSLLMGKKIGEKGFREQLALFFYEKEFMTVGHAASFCGLNMAEFKSLMQKNDIYLHYNHEDLVQDISTLDKVLGKA
jgi:predicted HTH domain antitoxin